MSRLMILEFMKRVWPAYGLGMLAYSIMLTVFFSVSSGHTYIWDMAMLLLAILAVTIMTTLPTAMPLVYCAWLFQQRRGIVISKITACFIGLLAGTVIHILVLGPRAFNADSSQTLLLALLCGGSCGLIFNLIFSCRGGFTLTKSAEQVAASDR